MIGNYREKNHVKLSLGEKLQRCQGKKMVKANRKRNPSPKEKPRWPLRQENEKEKKKLSSQTSNLHEELR